MDDFPPNLRSTWWQNQLFKLLLKKHLLNGPTLDSLSCKHTHPCLTSWIMASKLTRHFLYICYFLCFCLLPSSIHCKIYVLSAIVLGTCEGIQKWLKSAKLWVPKDFTFQWLVIIIGYHLLSTCCILGSVLVALPILYLYNFPARWNIPFNR